MSAAPTKRLSFSHPWAVVTFVVLVAAVPVLTSQWGRLRFGAERLRSADNSFTNAADREVILTWAGSSLGDARLPDLLTRLEPKPDFHGIARGGLPYLSEVTDPCRLLLELQGNGVSPTDAVLRLRGDLIGSGPLRLALSDAGQARLKHVRTELLERAQRELGLTLTVLPADAELSSSARIPIPNGDGVTSVEPVILSPSGEVLAGVEADHHLAIEVNGLRPGTAEAARLADWLLWQPLDAEPTSVKMIERAFFVPGSPIGLRLTLSDAGAADPAEAIARIRATTVDAGIAEADVRLAGAPVLVAAVAEDARLAVMGSWVPGTPWYEQFPLASSLLAAMLLAGLLAGELRRAIAVMVPAALSLLVVVAATAWLQISVTQLVLVAPVVVMISSLGWSGWVTSRALNSLESTPEGRVTDSLADVLRPTLCLAAIQSCAGLSFCVAGLPEQREAGLVIAVATPATWLISTFGTGSFLVLLHAPGGVMEALSATVALPTRSRSSRPMWGVLAVMVTCMALLAGGLATHRWTSDPANLLAQDHPVRRDLSRIDQELQGVCRAELCVRFNATAQQGMNLIDRLEMVRAIGSELRRQAGVTGVHSLADHQPVIEPPQDDSFRATTRYQKQAVELAQRLQDDSSASAAAWLISAPKDAEATWSGVLPGTRGGDEIWRLRILLDQNSGAEAPARLEMINRVAQEVLRLQAGAAHRVTGPLETAAHRDHLLSAGFVLAVILTAAFSAGVLALGLRSILSGVVAVALTLPPLTAALGAAMLGGLPIGPVLPLMATCGLSWVVMFVVPGFVEAHRSQKPGIGRATVQGLVLACVCGVTGGLLWKSGDSMLEQTGLLLSAITGAGAVSGLVLCPLVLSSRFGDTLIDSSDAADSQSLSESILAVTIEASGTAERPLSPLPRRNAG